MTLTLIPIQASSKFSQSIGSSPPQEFLSLQAVFFIAAENAMNAAPQGLPSATLIELDWREHAITASIAAGKPKPKPQPQP